MPRVKAVPLVAALALAACAQVKSPPPAPVAGDGAHDNLNAVTWMQRSAEYAAATRSLYAAATVALAARLAAQEDALAEDERVAAAAALPPAIVMDIDETVLDNSPYQARLIRDGAVFDDASWDVWVQQGYARAIPGAAEFARAAAARGVTVFYISNRTTGHHAATLANLCAEGFPVAGEHVFLGMGTEVPGCQQAKASEKRCRRQQVARQYRVLMQFGDQLGDFLTVADNSPAAREALMQRHAAWWGERWWMLPNPSYGGWEGALLQGQRQQDAGNPHRGKRAALVFDFKNHK